MVEVTSAFNISIEQIITMGCGNRFQSDIMRGTHGCLCWVLQVWWKMRNPCTFQRWYKSVVVAISTFPFVILHILTSLSYLRLCLRLCLFTCFLTCHQVLMFFVVCLEDKCCHISGTKTDCYIIYIIHTSVRHNTTEPYEFAIYTSQGNWCVI